jgi:uncharacterized protein DUF6923/exosortase sorting signal-containing protein
MKRGTLYLAAAALFTAVVPGLQAQTLYMATGSNGIDGSLYTVNATTAAATLVGPLLIGASPIGLTGLAVNPITGVLYGVTTNDGNSPNHALVTINQTTGGAVLVGDLGVVVSDIAFASNGVLYGWVGGSTNRLATINLSTGLATQLGPSGVAGGTPCANGGNGLSFANGVLYVAPKGVTGNLYSVNTTTGALTAGPVMSGAPVTSCGALDAMATSPSGVLFAIDTNRSVSPTTNALVTVNPTTGAITQVGVINLPGDADALAFATLVAPVPAVSTWGLVGLGLLLAAIGFRLIVRN